MQLLWTVILQSHGLEKILLERGNADPGIADTSGRTGLPWIVENGRSHIPREPPIGGMEAD